MTAYISKQLNTKQKPVLLWVLLGIVALLVILYAYFLNMAVLSVISRQSLNQSITIATSDIGALEGRYSTLEVGITADKALSLGLAPAPSVAYLSDAPQPLLSLAPVNSQ
ncbi:MAG TPA: hypothetical protein VMR73_02250 [Candidatus Paceibacterota bacterium]|nr:hypothetical protein [Candidatus Paceibacterota bacterium]